MTVPSTTNRSGPYMGNGVTTSFSYEFRIVNPAHVTVIRAEGGIETTLVLNTDYTVNDIGNAGGGSVVISPAPTTGQSIVILRDVPFVQETDLENQGAYYAETVERTFDLSVMRDQQLQEQIDRTVKIPPSADAASLGSLVRDIIRLGDSADNIDTVANNIADVNDVAANMPDVNTVAGIADKINDVATEAKQSAGSAKASADRAELWAQEAGQHVDGVTPTVVRFSGDAIETEFDLGIATLDEKLTNVFIDGVYQQKDTYEVVDGVLTFSDAPPAGSDNIEINIGGTTAQAFAIPSNGTVIPEKFGARTIAPFETLADAISSIIPHQVKAIQTAGYYSAGSGGEALYNEGDGNLPGGFFSNGGTRGWEIASTWLNVRSLGARPGADSAPAFAAAATLASRVVYVPAGDYTVSLTQANAAPILSLLSRIRLDGTLTLVAPDTVIDLTAQVVIDTPDAHRVFVRGTGAFETSIAHQVDVSGVAKAYHVNLAVLDRSNAQIGDYALIKHDVAGSGDIYAHCGFWKIVGVDEGGPNRITVLNTHHRAFPVNGIGGGTVRVIKSLFRTAGADGWRYQSDGLGDFDDVGVVGDWDVFSSTGTLGAHGVVTASPTIVAGGDSNAIFRPIGNVVLGKHVGISGWGEQGLAVSGRSMLIANYVAFSSNRKRGCYAEGAATRQKFSISSGNGEDGFISDTGGFMQLALSVAAGNGLNGYWAANAGLIVAATSKSSGNLRGYEVRGLGRITAELSIALRNEVGGYVANNGGMIKADSSSALENGGDGYETDLSSFIDARSSTSIGNSGYGYDANMSCGINASGCTVSGNALGSYRQRNLAQIIDASGSPRPLELSAQTVTADGILRTNTALHVYHTNLTANYRLLMTSGGDLYFGSGTTSRIAMRAGGVLMSAMDDAASLGQAGNRWSEIFAGNATINTSDAREKDWRSSLNEDELRVARRLSKLIGIFRWNSAIAAKGDAARLHVGILAQDVIEAFAAEGLDARRYSLLCHDAWEDDWLEWSDEYEVIPAVEELDEENNLFEVHPERRVLVRPAGRELVTKAGDRYGIRYEELLAFMAAGFEARLANLEQKG